MARTLLLTTVFAFALAGCVAVDPGQTTTPSAAPTFAITTPAAATAAPSTSPTATPTATPTVAPPPTAAPATATAGPTLPPTAAAATATPAPVGPVSFGATEPIFTDDFSDTSSGWGLVTGEYGTVGYGDGALELQTTAVQNSVWSGRLLGEDWTVVRAEGAFVPSAAGYMGFLCASGTERLFGGVVTTGGEWGFVEVTDAGVNLLTNGTGAGWSVPTGLATPVALDCATGVTGALRMQVSLPEQDVAAMYEGTDGPDSFDRIGVYAESASHPWTLDVDDVSAFGGLGLLGRVPEAWRDECFANEPSAFETGALESVSCPLAQVGGNSDVADYVQFDTQDNMDVAYQARVDAWAVDPTASCRTGPNEATYTIAGTTVGRILCAPQPAGIRFDWTLDSLMILSTLTNFDGSYEDTYADWLIAGPL